MEPILRLIETPFVLLSRLRRARRPADGDPARQRGIAVDLDTGGPWDPPASDLARHAYLLGATGSGKTTAILALLGLDLRAGHSVAVVDLRGDLVAGTLSLCERLGVGPERVSLLDLREKSRVRGFDPLSGAGEPYVRALHALDAVSAEAESWGVQLEETMRSAFLLLAHARRPLTDLERLLSDRRFREDCLGTVEDEALARFWQRYGAMSDERQAAWTTPVLNKVTPLLAVPVLRRVLSGEEGICLGAVLAEPGSVLLVSLAVDELHRSARMLGSLLVSSVSREMMARVDVPERERNPVRLYVDEFENMASEAFEGLIAEGRRFGLTLVLSHQTLAQLPQRLRSVVRNNVGIQVVFGLGFEDAQALARELPEDVSAADLRALPPGGAYLLARDGEVRRLRFHRPEKPRPAAKARAYRDIVLPGSPPARREDGGEEEGAPSVRADEGFPEDLL